MGDRFQDFRADTARQIEYREAYAALAATDPKAALAFPHPDDADLNVVEALARIRGAAGPLRADPPVDIRA